jgi:hypothetical protein
MLEHNGASKTYTGTTPSHRTERTKMYARKQLQIGSSRAYGTVHRTQLARGRLQPRLSEAQLIPHRNWLRRIIASEPDCSLLGWKLGYASDPYRGRP